MNMLVMDSSEQLVSNTDKFICPLCKKNIVICKCDEFKDMVC